MAAIAPIFVLMLIILIPLLFAFWATFCRHVVVTGSMLPLGYESTVTESNKMQVGSAWVTYFADCGFWFLVCFAPKVAT